MNLLDNTLNHVGVIVVAYQPDEVLLTQNINAMLQNSNLKVIIVNNGSGLTISTNGPERVSVLNLGSNKGIAFAQNEGVRLAINLGLEFVTFFDQDSQIPSGFLQTLMRDWFKISVDHPDIGMLVAEYFDRNLGRKETFAVIENDRLVRKSIPAGQFCTQVSMPISSGSLVKLEVFKKVGLFRSEFFIDWVDNEFDLRLIAAGYEIWAVNNAVLNHAVGDKKARKFLGRTFYPSNHSPMRLYYYMRNGLWTWKLFGKEFPGFPKLFAKTFFGKLFFAVAFEDRKIMRIKYILKGTFDGIKGSANAAERVSDN